MSADHVRRCSPVPLSLLSAAGDWCLPIDLTAKNSDHVIKEVSAMLLDENTVEVFAAGLSDHPTEGGVMNLAASGQLVLTTREY